MKAINEIRRLKRELKGLNLNTETLEVQLASQKEIVLQKENDLNKLKAQIDSLKDETVGLNTELISLKVKILSLETESANLKSELNILKSAPPLKHQP